MRSFTDWISSALVDWIWTFCETGFSYFSSIWRPNANWRRSEYSTRNFETTWCSFSILRVLYPFSTGPRGWSLASFSCSRYFFCMAASRSSNCFSRDLLCSRVGISKEILLAVFFCCWCYVPDLELARAAGCAVYLFYSIIGGGTFNSFSSIFGSCFRA